MLDKIRGALEAGKIAEEVSVKLESHQQKLSEQTAVIQKLLNSVSELTDSVSTLKSYHEELQHTYKQSISVAEKLKDELASDVINVQVLKSQLQNQIVAKVSEELNKFTGQFKGKLDEVGRLHEQTILIAGDVGKVRDEINRFTTISSRLKDTDFQLTNYAQKLETNDKEKLQLMRQIDSLQRLVSKMRQQQL